jgi:putative DNA primase/helicase
VLPFTQRFDGVKRDAGLLDALKAEGSGILNWMLTRCLVWQRKGLMPSERVLAATTEYEKESNPFTEFLAERCEMGGQFECSASDLREEYESWMESEHSCEEMATGTSFGRWLGKRFKKHHTAGGNVYAGLRVRENLQ